MAAVWENALVVVQTHSTVGFSGHPTCRRVCALLPPSPVITKSKWLGFLENPPLWLPFGCSWLKVLSASMLNDSFCSSAWGNSLCSLARPRRLSLASPPLPFCLCLCVNLIRRRRDSPQSLIHHLQFPFY